MHARQSPGELYGVETKNIKRATQFNIAIMQTFVKIRLTPATHEDLLKKVEEMDMKYDEQFRVVFETIRQLLQEEEKPKRKI